MLSPVSVGNCVFPGVICSPDTLQIQKQSCKSGCAEKGFNFGERAEIYHIYRILSGRKREFSNEKEGVHGLSDDCFWAKRAI